MPLTFSSREPFPASCDGIDDLRRKVVASVLRPYEDLDASPKLDSSYFRSQVDSIIECGWERWSVRIPSIRPPIPWEGHRGSFDYSLHSFEPLNYILRAYSYSNDRRYLEIALDFGLDWCLANQARLLGHSEEIEIDRIVTEGSRAVWYDMAVGQRTYRLAYLLDIAARVTSVSDEAISILLRSLDFHHSLLSREAFFRRTSNHGVYQALGQLAAARRFSWYPPHRQYVELATNRVRELVQRQFTASGVHREHSPGYHYMVMGSYIGAIATGVVTEPDIVSAIGRMEEALSWMIKPNGMIVTMGDSDPRTLRSNTDTANRYQNQALKYLVTNGQLGVAPPSGVRSYPDAGYAFARLYSSKTADIPENAAYFAQMAGFHSRVHKHADHLSFVWYDRNRDILIDPGRYAYTSKTKPGSELYEDGFWYADPKRVYCEATHSHNAVEIDGRSYSRNKVKPFGSALVYAGEQDGFAITECAVTHFRSILHRRQLVMRPGHFLLVLDWLYDRSATPHDFRQWFHFADSWHVTGDSHLIHAHHPGSDGLPTCDITGASLTNEGALGPVVRGQSEPTLLGWLSDKPYSLIPTSCFNVHMHSCGPAQLATLFVFGKTLEIDRKATRFNRSMRVGQIVWSDERGPQRFFLKSPSVKAAVATQ